MYKIIYNTYKHLIGKIRVGLLIVNSSIIDWSIIW